VIDGLLGLPVALLRGAGLVLVPYVALVAFVATRRRIEPAAVWLIIACNALWALASFVLLLSGELAPTGLGIAFVAAQAIIVALLGELQYMGLRRPAAQAA
jgi:glucose uptake protein GlcU